MTLDSLCFVELIMRTQQGAGGNQGNEQMRQNEKCFVRDKWQIRRSLCSFARVVQPLLSNKASAFCHLLSFGNEKKKESKIFLH